MICNHTSIIDGIILGVKVMTGFTLDIGLKKKTIIATVANALGSLYIPRGGTREIKD